MLFSKSSASPSSPAPTDCVSYSHERSCQRVFHRSDEENADDGQTKGSTLDCEVRKEGDTPEAGAKMMTKTARRKPILLPLFVSLAGMLVVVSISTIVIVSDILLFLAEVQLVQVNPAYYTDPLHLLSSATGSQDSTLTASTNGLQLALRGYNPLLFPLSLQVERIEVFFRASQGGLDIVRTKLKKTEEFHYEEAVSMKQSDAKQHKMKSEFAKSQQANQETPKRNRTQTETRVAGEMGRGLEATVAFDPQALHNHNLMDLSSKHREALPPGLNESRQTTRHLSANPRRSVPSHPRRGNNGEPDADLRGGRHAPQVRDAGSPSLSRSSRPPLRENFGHKEIESDENSFHQHYLSIFRKLSSFQDVRVDCGTNGRGERCKLQHARQLKDVVSSSEGPEISPGNDGMFEDLANNIHSEEEFLHDAGDGIPAELWEKPSYIPGRQLHPLQVDAVSVEREPREALVEHYRNENAGTVHGVEAPWKLVSDDEEGAHSPGEEVGEIDEEAGKTRVDTRNKYNPVLVQDLLDSLIPLRSDTAHAIREEILSRTGADELVSSEPPYNESSTTALFPGGFNNEDRFSSIDYVPVDFFTDRDPGEASSSADSASLPLSTDTRNHSLVSVSTYIQTWNASSPVSQEALTEDRTAQMPAGQASDDLSLSRPRWRKLFDVAQVESQSSARVPTDRGVSEQPKKALSAGFKLNPRQHIDEALHVSGNETWTLRKGEEVHDTVLELIVTCLHEGFLQLEIQLSDPHLQIAGGMIYSKRMKPIRSQSVFVPCEFLGNVDLE